MSKHLTSIQKVIKYPGGTVHGWFAHCHKCEWSGTVRKTIRRAEVDAEHHKR